MDMARRYGVSRETVRRAMQMLEADGLIVRKVSAGTFVCQRKTNYAISSIHESFTEQMRRQGKTPSSDIRSIEMLVDLPLAITTELQISEKEKVYRITRIRLADGIPMAYEIAYVRQKLCPNLHTLLLDDTSLYEVYENHYCLDMQHIDLKMEAVHADESMRKDLGLSGNDALLKMTSTMYLADNIPLYHVISYHIGEKYELTMRMPRKV